MVLSEHSYEYIHTFQGIEQTLLVQMGSTLSAIASDPIKPLKVPTEQAVRRIYYLQSS